jgi:hypothetical protein
MDMNYEYLFISGKKISLFARAVTEIFNFFSVTWLLGHPVYAQNIEK